MFGYATDETEECMPLTILLAHKLNYRLKELSRNGECPWIKPDSKSQVSHLKVWKRGNKEIKYQAAGCEAAGKGHIQTIQVPAHVAGKKGMKEQWQSDEE